MAMFDENSESQESYTNTAKRAKKPHFSDQEMEVLIEEVALDAKLLFSSFQNGITNAKKKFAWLRITTRVNAVGANGRTPEQIKKRWKDVKQAVIKRKQQLAETGGGPPPPPLPFEDAVLAVIGDNMSGYRHPWSASHHETPGRFRAYSSQTLSNPEYCVKLVKNHDYENYLCCLLLPKQLQRAAFAVRAFNVELAQVRDVVSEKTIGAMRMQFWKDAVDKLLEGSPPQTPVAVELAGAARYFKMSKRHFKNIVEARAGQLETDGFRTLEEIEKYAENTSSSLHYLVLECLGVKNVHADHAASHIGKAQGLTTVLRALPYHAQRRRVYLPLDLIVKHKVSQEDVIRGRSEQSLLDAVFDLASAAHVHLQTARSFQKDVPKEAFGAFLNTLPCDLYLQNLEKVNFNAFDPKLQGRNSSLPFQLWLQKQRRKY
ncbi:hypothetical protein ACOMHN_052323 [Nucella lapillus]